MNDLQGMRCIEADPRVMASIRSGMSPLRRPIPASDWATSHSRIGSKKVANTGIERLDEAWARGDSAARARRFCGPVPYAGWDWGIRQPEPDETPVCWTEVVCFLHIGAHESDA